MAYEIANDAGESFAGRFGLEEVMLIKSTAVADRQFRWC